MYWAGSGWSRGEAIDYEVDKSAMIKGSRLCKSKLYKNRRELLEIEEICRV
jgi:hypothetical protein